MKRSILIFALIILATYIGKGQSSSATTTLSGTPMPGNPSQFLGSQNGYDVIFKSWNIERMRLLSIGYFGVGTPNPLGLFSVGTASQFQVSSTGVIKSSNLVANNFVYTTTGGQLTTTPNTAILAVTNGGTGKKALTGILQGNDMAAYTALLGTANYLPKWSATAPYLTVNSLVYDNGTYLGVGTIVPKVKMHLHSTEMVTEGGGGSGSPQGPMGTILDGTYAYSAFQITNAATTEVAESGLMLKQVDLNSQIWAKSGTLSLNAAGGFSLFSTGAAIDANTGGLSLRGANFLFHAQTGSFVFETPAGGNALTIANNGNVGIVTASPTEKLDITGNIKCTGKIGVNTAIQSGYALAVDGKMIISDEVTIKIRTEWSDFVFNKEYSLLSLSELEKFIKSNNHLPNVPSAKDVKKDGVNVGEMNAILLQKVEELTLYIINQDKKINELEKKINNK